MKKRRIYVICLVCLLVLAAAIFAVVRSRADEGVVSKKNAENFGALLTDMALAAEDPAGENASKIDADLAAIRKTNRQDLELAQAIADHWRQVYLDPAYELCLYRGEEEADVLRQAGVPDGGKHAIVVLGYELMDGEMQPELVGRCETAAAAARALPSAILVCTGGATGENNPDKHTEAGLMKDYMVNECGVDPARIFIDESAMTTQENAVNTYKILQANGIGTMTIVTSSYHQRWGQAVYHALGELYRRQNGYDVKIVGNYCYDTEPTVPLYRKDARIAVMQIAGILELPEEVIRSLPPFMERPAGEDR